MGQKLLYKLSALETRAVMTLLRRNPVKVLFAFHCLAGICGMRFLAPTIGKADKDYSRKCGIFAMAYGGGMTPGIPFSEDQILSFSTSSGSSPAWCYSEFGIPAFDIEISGQLEPDALAQCRIDATDLPLLRQYQQKHAGGIAAVLRKLLENNT